MESIYRIEKPIFSLEDIINNIKGEIKCLYSKEKH